jgi:integrase
VARGTIIQRPSKRYGVVFGIKYRDAAGTQVQETVGRQSEGYTKRQAEAELRDRIERVDKQRWTRPKPQLFSDYAEAWPDRVERVKRWKAKTKSEYVGDIRNHLVPAFGSIALTEIQTKHVNAWIAKRLETGVTAKTATRELTVLGQVLDTAKEEGLIFENPARNARHPKVTPYKSRPLTVQEAQRLQTKLDRDEHPQVGLVFKMLVLTGLRWNELRHLRWEDIAFMESPPRLYVREGKTEDSARAVALSPNLVEALTDHYTRTSYKADTDYCFPHPDKGTLWPHRAYRDAFHRAVKALGLEGRIRPAHDLRVTSLTQGALAGEAPLKLMARAGHRSFATTTGYLRLAGVVFGDEASALEKRMAGEQNLVPNFVPTEEDPTVLSGNEGA